MTHYTKQAIVINLLVLAGFEMGLMRVVVATEGLMSNLESSLSQLK